MQTLIQHLKKQRDINKQKSFKKDFTNEKSYGKMSFVTDTGGLESPRF